MKSSSCQISYILSRPNKLRSSTTSPLEPSSAPIIKAKNPWAQRASSAHSWSSPRPIMFTITRGKIEGRERISGFTPMHMAPSVTEFKY